MFDRLEELDKRYDELEGLISDPEVMANQNKFQSYAKEMARITEIVKAYRSYKKNEENLIDADTSIKDEKDPEMLTLYEEELDVCKKQKEKLISKLEDLLLDEDDPNSGKDIIMEIRAGTGGEEAALFSADLFRMYSKFASSKGLKVDVMNTNPTGIGGLKEVVFGISGGDAYKLLQFESGTHRVQRVPETETSGRIHTSAVTVAVLPEAEDVEIEIDQNDLRIDVYRSSGPGGQSVNTTDSAVRITHEPTGLVVTCQDEKSQIKNKAKAFRVLKARLYDKMMHEQASSIAQERKEQVGSGDRSGRIRTYNFPDKRVTDHRIGLTLYSLENFLEGDIDEMLSALEADHREKRLMGMSG